MSRVLLQELDLVFQRDSGGAAPIQRDAEQVAQSADHPVGVLRVAVKERRNRVKRVEQEMRMELGLQRLESGLHQSGFELSLFQLLHL